MPFLEIGSKKIGDGFPCFLIAEAGVNHNGDLEIARRLVDAARQAGADAVKFQSFKADRVISAGAPKAEYQKVTTGNQEKQLEMVRRLEMPAEMTHAVAGYAHEKGILFLSTGFDEENIDLLDSLGVPAFKVGSGDVTDLPLLEFIGRKRKPVILSTGMSFLYEVEAAVATLTAAGCPAIALLQCVSSYPADPAASNLRTIQTLKDRFSTPVGFSDHSPGIEVAIAAVAMGASIIEKHITMDTTLPGPDHRVSLEPAAFSKLTQAIRLVESSFGDGVKQPTPGELNVREVARRSVVAACPIPRGTAITMQMLAFKRPGNGISPAEWKSVVGKIAARDIADDSLITREDLL